MSLLKIARLGHPVIRQGAAPVTREELLSDSVQRLIDDMVETMRDAEGVGIAAPQVHAPMRIAAIEVTSDNARYPAQSEVPLLILVNPEILTHTDATEDGWEGCLSVPDLRGQVPRWSALTVSAWDRAGNPLTIEAKGFFARVVQHEVDHLNGHVYLDRVKDTSTLTHLREYQRYWVQPQP
jgi:peptide deformylase